MFPKVGVPSYTLTAMQGGSNSSVFFPTLTFRFNSRIHWAKAEGIAVWAGTGL